MKAFVWFNGRQATSMMGFPQVFVKNKALEVKLLAPLFHCTESFQDMVQLFACQITQTTKAGRMILW
jgi:hypothetical protein